MGAVRTIYCSKCEKHLKINTNHTRYMAEEFLEDYKLMNPGLENLIHGPVGDQFAVYFPLNRSCLVNHPEKLSTQRLRPESVEPSFQGLEGIR